MFTEPVSDVRRETMIQELRTDLRQMQRGLRLEAREKHSVSTGIVPLDDILPDRGLCPGTLSEWIAAEAGSGATTLAMQAAGRVQNAGPLIIVDSRLSFYAPAFRAVGVCADKAILIRPKSRADVLWALEQSLRCPGIGAVLCPIDRLKTQEFRRLQLAAEAGTAVGILIRPPAATRQPGWADVRLLVRPAPSLPQSFHRRMEVRCVYAKGGMADQSVELEMCDETGALRLAAGLSDSTAALRTAGA